MLWCYELLQEIRDGEQLINDSKTPSGRVHVGALRGVLIHDAMFRALRQSDRSARYSFGVDDYDPLDELPAGEPDFFRPHLGKPLCDVPAPPGSAASDVAEHYIGEFFEIFEELGVVAETYRMRDVYRSGRFNEAIDAILGKADAVRRLYLEVSGSDRPESWHPLQVVCEACGRIGTTRVFGYDGSEVDYTCEPGLVAWATGCGHTGRVSPFDGRAKLPWKLEWAAKWHVFGVTIEGAGKDHNTRGGARDVAAACLREIFGAEPPLNIPYEFFLVGGAKMSSSRGVGAAAREIADLLTPEALRFLLLRARPNRPVDFHADEAQIIKVYNDLDRYHRRAYDPSGTEDERQVYQLSEVTPEGEFFDASFQLVLTLVQMPHLDIEAEFEKRKGSPLGDVERRHLRARVASAHTWLERYATEAERTVVQKALPARAAELGAAQRGFLQRLAQALRDAPWEEDAIQATIFDVARLTPLPQRDAFEAVYRVVLDRDSGPKAGSLLAFLERDFATSRLAELPCAEAEFFEETAVDAEACGRWLGELGARVRSVRALEFHPLEAGADPRGALDLRVALDDDKTHLRRLRIERRSALAERVAELETRCSVRIELPDELR
ncbi:MAG: lysine--tRNA ligase [Deltaproteobacteria bacterium]|nr:MAG: lysine--tRNA ligase [Deltaproteobacteria bacterium]